MRVPLCNIRKRTRGRLVVSLVTLLLTALGGPAFAQIDPSGEWGALFHEDWPHRWPGPEIGDYTGLPINDASRFRAESWNASILTMPEHQTKPHPSAYAMRGPANIRILKVFDASREQVIAYEIFGTYGRATRLIWMDGRTHPPSYAAHTWAGFSTGRWDGHTLTVMTTHLKQGWLQRNGVFHSDQATMFEQIVRHGNYLTVATIVDDPITLTEPFIRTSNWKLDPNQRLSPSAWGTDQIVVEVVRPKGAVPHYLPGRNTALAEFSRRHGVPMEAARGGAATMYPEYIRELSTMSFPRPVQPDPILQQWWEQWRDRCNCGTGRGQ